MGDKTKFKSKIEENYKKINEDNAWQMIFFSIRQKSREQECSDKTSIARKITNSRLNRYSNVLPFNDTRIKLNKLDNDYINASLVKVDDAERNYILTQGPLKSTLSHFWLMIWEQNSRCIVMLNKLFENGIDKCYCYWPIEQNHHLKFNDVNLEVELINEQGDDKNNDFIIREFRLKNLEDNTERTIYHFHFLQWPDHGIPQSSTFINFFFKVRESNLLDTSKFGPAIVHCSAGIGRSGTFVLVDSFLILFKKSLKESEKNKEPEILELLLEMRKYRLGLVQTPSQLKFAYEVIIDAINSNKFKEENENFNKLDQNKSENMSSLNNQSSHQQSQNNDKELRRRLKEERNKVTMNHINRIKNKQKEIDAWKNKKKIFTNVGLVVGIGALFISTIYYKYLN